MLLKNCFTITVFVACSAALAGGCGGLRRLPIQRQRTAAPPASAAAPRVWTRRPARAAAWARARAAAPGGSTDPFDAGGSDAVFVDSGAVDVPVSNCVAGGACVPANPCHKGMFVCNEGAMTCMELTDTQANGTVCGHEHGLPQRDLRRVHRGHGVRRDRQAVPRRQHRLHDGRARLHGDGQQAERHELRHRDGLPGGDLRDLPDGRPVPADEPVSQRDAGLLGRGADLHGREHQRRRGHRLRRGHGVQRDGACAACVAGMTCTVPGKPCSRGTIACNTGTPVCIESGNHPTGRRAAPTWSAATAPAPRARWGRSASPRIRATPASPSARRRSAARTPATRSPTAPQCGTDRVCNAGTCVSCAAGASCQPTNPCKTGATSCATGSPVCMESGNRASGTMCGANMVCNATGTCVTCRPTAPARRPIPATPGRSPARRARRSAPTAGQNQCRRHRLRREPGVQDRQLRRVRRESALPADQPVQERRDVVRDRRVGVRGDDQQGRRHAVRRGPVVRERHADAAGDVQRERGVRGRDDAVPEPDLQHRRHRLRDLPDRSDQLPHRLQGPDARRDELRPVRQRLSGAAAGDGHRRLRQLHLQHLLQSRLTSSARRRSASPCASRPGGTSRT